MKTLNKAILALAISSVLAMGASAAVSYGANGVGQPYVGIKVGQFDADIRDANADKPTAYGVYGGYNFDKNFGIEAEYVGSDDADLKAGSARAEYDAKTYGAYGTYRYQFAGTPVYAKGKLGLAKTEVETSKGDLVLDYDKTSLAGGVGLGFQPTANFGIEAGYNYLNSDVNMWGVGAHIAF